MAKLGHSAGTDEPRSNSPLGIHCVLVPAEIQHGYPRASCRHEQSTAGCADIRSHVAKLLIALPPLMRWQSGNEFATVPFDVEQLQSGPSSTEGGPGRGGVGGGSLLRCCGQQVPVLWGHGWLPLGMQALASTRCPLNVARPLQVRGFGKSAQVRTKLQSAKLRFVFDVAQPSADRCVHVSDT